ncbi:MAG: hypothetical protein K6L81_09575 [Agarilytica sp.]
MRNISFIILTQLILLFSNTAYARKTELVDPQTITPPSGLSAEHVKAAIEGAIKEKSWQQEDVGNESSSSIKTTLKVRTHSISLNIDYTPEAISFSYAGSENMKFKEKKGKRYIHPSYAKWSQALADQISNNIEQGKDYTFDPNFAANRNQGKSNPPPTQPFSTFSHFELEPSTLSVRLQNHKGSQATQRNLDHNLEAKLLPLLEEWNQKAPQKKNTLVIKPHIDALRFIGTGARFWGGMLAGSSWILVRLEFSDKVSGKPIAEPELFRVAQAGNGFSLARNDYAMVEHMAGDIAQYVQNNYSTATGGGTYPAEKFRQIARDNSRPKKK